MVQPTGFDSSVAVERPLSRPDDIEGAIRRLNACGGLDHRELIARGHIQLTCMQAEPRRHSL